MLDSLDRLAEWLRPRLQLWIALAVILPRLTFVTVKPERCVSGNAPDMLIVAHSIATGHGYVNAWGKPDSYFNPGYIVLLAGCQLLTGDSLILVKLAQVAFDVLTALVLYRLLITVASRRAPLLFVSAFALHPLLIHYVNNINDEPMLTTLLALSFTSLYAALRRPSYGRFSLAGITIGLATLTKGTPLFLSFVLAFLFLSAWRNFSQVRWCHWITYLCVFLAMLLPWAYRNYRALGRFAFSVRGFGTNLWWGSDPRIFAQYGDARFAAVAKIEREMEVKGVLRPVKSDVFENEKWRFAMAVQQYKELLSHPTELTKLLFAKATRSLYATEGRPSVEKLLIIIQLPVLLLGIVGLRRFWTEPKTRPLAALFIAFIGYYYFMVSVGMPIVRYFVPALPLVLALAAVGLSTIVPTNQDEASPAKS